MRLLTRRHARWWQHSIRIVKRILSQTTGPRLGSLGTRSRPAVQRHGNHAFIVLSSRARFGQGFHVLALGFVCSRARSEAGLFDVLHGPVHLPGIRNTSTMTADEHHGCGEQHNNSTGNDTNQGHARDAGIGCRRRGSIGCLWVCCRTGSCHDRASDGELGRTRTLFIASVIVGIKAMLFSGEGRQGTH